MLETGERLLILRLKKIRKSLLNQGKLRKYIGYAIGEVLLVVIGILIALQVNNYNIQKQAKSVELQYYQTMKIQLVEDRKRIENEISGVTERINDYSSAIKSIANNEREQLEDFGRKVYRLLEYGDFRRGSSVYQTLIYSGEIRYIKNKDIVKSLQELERVYQISERLEAIQANVAITQVGPTINEVLDFESGRLVSPDSVFTDSFKNRFSIAIRLASEKKQEFENAISVIDNTLNEIDAELNDR